MVPAVVADGGPPAARTLRPRSGGRAVRRRLADMHATALVFPEVPDVLRALARHFPAAVVANADHDCLMRCLDHNGLGFDLVVDSETARCYKPDPGSSSGRATPFPYP